jgi:hypothetical protein
MATTNGSLFWTQNLSVPTTMDVNSSVTAGYIPTFNMTAGKTYLITAFAQVRNNNSFAVGVGNRLLINLPSGQVEPMQRFVTNVRDNLHHYALQPISFLFDAPESGDVAIMHNIYVGSSAAGPSTVVDIPYASIQVSEVN